MSKLTARMQAALAPVIQPVRDRGGRSRMVPYKGTMRRVAEVVWSRCRASFKTHHRTA